VAKGDVQGILGGRRKFGLKAKVKTSLGGTGFFEAQIFLENPAHISAETFRSEQLFPGVQRLLEGGTVNRRR
jgi:hypothetical protein